MSDFIIQQGTDASYSWDITNEDGSDFDPTGWSAKMQIKSHTGNLLHEFSIEDDNLSFGTNIVLVYWTATETYSWSWLGGRYDLYLYNDTQKFRADSGYIMLSKAVTSA